MARRKYRNRHRNLTTHTKLNSESKKYIPLFGTWLIDLAIYHGWHETRSKRQWPDIFEDTNFCAMTGMLQMEDPDEDEDEVPKSITTSRCRAILMQQRKVLQKMELPEELPLLHNVDLIGELLDLSEAEKVVLTFAAGLAALPEFRDAISSRSEKVSIPSFCQALNRMTGISDQDLILALHRDGSLITTGLLEINKYNACDFEDKVTLMEGLSDLMLTSHQKSGELVARFMRKAAQPTLSLDNFPHMQRDRDILTRYLKKSIIEKERGVNILLHGKPGVGKNEFVQALANELKVELFEVSFANENGDPIKGEARLKAYALCQRLLAYHGNALLLFDEIEDVFPGNFDLFSMLFGGDDSNQGTVCGGKAWINRTMENNMVPSVWISNRIGQIEKAYLRRFDYSVNFPTPPLKVRVSMAEHHFGDFEPPHAWLERLASNELISPAQYERAAKVARISCNGDKLFALELVEQALDRSISLLGQRRSPTRNVIRTGYSLEWLNTDVPVSQLVEGIKKRPKGTFCFYGAPGTGKSELARYIADQAGKPMILKRASDILSKWVGDSEKNIAQMFDEARQQDAVLVLDEADSFLADRRDAQRNWEITQVNELLTQIEAFEGIFVCTTNLMTKLDQASLRRFAFKVRFDPLKPEQRVALFKQELDRLGYSGAGYTEWEGKIRKLEQLTPGDFAVAARQFELWNEQATPVRMFEILKLECEAKGVAPMRIGF